MSLFEVLRVDQQLTIRRPEAPYWRTTAFDGLAIGAGLLLCLTVAVGLCDPRVNRLIVLAFLGVLVPFVVVLGSGARRRYRKARARAALPRSERGFLFDRSAEQLRHDGEPICPLSRIDHVELAKERDCNGDWYRCTLMLSDKTPIQIGSVDEPDARRLEEIRRIARTIAEHVGCGLIETDETGT